MATIQRRHCSTAIGNYKKICAGEASVSKQRNKHLKSESPAFQVVLSHPAERAGYRCGFATTAAAKAKIFFRLFSGFRDARMQPSRGAQSNAEFENQTAFAGVKS